MAAIVFTVQPVAQSFVIGAVDGTLSVEVAPDQGNITYEWQVGAESDGSDLAPVVSGGDTATYTIPPASTVGTLYYACSVASDNVSFDETLSNIVAVEVTAAEIVITAEPVDQPLEPDEEPTAFEVVATYDGINVLEYQWYSCDDAEKTNPVLIAEATSATYTPEAPTAGTSAFYFCRLSADDVALDVDTAVVEISMEGTITITVQPADQVVAGGDDPVAMSVTATTTDDDPITYQWYKCDNVSKLNPVAISPGGTTNTISFGTMTPGYSTYYFCRLATADSDPVDTRVATVTQNGIVPILTPGDYITNEYVNDYIAQCSAEVQQRFIDQQAITGIEIPATGEGTVALRSAQIELFMRVI